LRQSAFQYKHLLNNKTLVVYLLYCLFLRIYQEMQIVLAINIDVLLIRSTLKPPYRIISQKQDRLLRHYYVKLDALFSVAFKGTLWLTTIYIHWLPNIRLSQGYLETIDPGGFQEL